MKKITLTQWTSLWIFPILQVTTFALFCLVIDQHFWAILFLPLSAFFLNFSLHITYHYTVHFPFKSAALQQLAGIAKTLLMGLPFHYYLMSHWNHHKHNNGLDDFTTTWKAVDNQIVPKNVFIYALFWPFSSSKSLPLQIEQGRKEGYCTPRVQKRMLIELGALLVWVAFMALYAWPWLCGYYVMVYIGWMLIALQNYGQHLPQQYGAPKANTYLSRWYNWLFINNGLHEEHHEEPAKSYWELKPQAQTPHSVIAKPHLIEPFFHPKNQ